MFVVTIDLSSLCVYIITLNVVLFFNVSASNPKLKGIIYIVQWTCYIKDTMDSYTLLEAGQQSFVSRNCSFQNCFMTYNRSYFDNVLDFDVLMFSIQHLRPNQPIQFASFYDPPLNRSKSQLYVLLASEPATLFSISDFYNGVFNLTWTYKLASDIFRPFFVVKNNIGEIVGPKVDVRWTDVNDMAPTNGSIVQKLRNKHIAAAWVVSSHCGKQFYRHIFVTKLQRELSKYGHRLDIYGECGNMSCPRTKLDKDHLLSSCYHKIESDYYFYLAFENTYSEDYITEKVLHGLLHFTVPIVHGGGDYTRFLPHGSYFDASKLKPETLAKEMYDIINDPQRYYDFFKWHGYYTFQDTSDDDHTETVCALCAYINAEKLKPENSDHIYYNIPNWWNVKYPSASTTSAAPQHIEVVNEHEEQTESFLSKVFNFLFDE